MRNISHLAQHDYNPEYEFKRLPGDKYWDATRDPEFGMGDSWLYRAGYPNLHLKFRIFRPNFNI